MKYIKYHLYSILSHKSLKDTYMSGCLLRDKVYDIKGFTNNFSSRGSTYSNGWAIKIFLRTLPRDLSRSHLFSNLNSQKKIRFYL